MVFFSAQTVTPDMVLKAPKLSTIFIGKIVWFPRGPECAQIMEAFCDLYDKSGRSNQQSLCFICVTLAKKTSAGKEIMCLIAH